MLGIHFAQSSVALSVLAEDGVTLAHCVTRPCGREDAAGVLADLVAELGLRGTAAFVTLSRADYDSQYVDLPGVSDAELRDALQWRVTPPGVLTADEIVVSGARLTNDREIGAGGAPLVRATVMARSTLERVINAVIGAGLDLQGIYPRETALINLARRDLAATGVAMDDAATEPPVMAVFIGPRSTGITITRGARLYLSRTVQMEVPPERGLQAQQAELLVEECQRTADNFNKRLSQTPLNQVLIGPAVKGVEAVHKALGDDEGVVSHGLGLPQDIVPADEESAATAATPQGLLSLAAALNTDLPDSASLYQRPPKARSNTSPRMLAAGIAAGIAALAGISGLQSLMIHNAEEQLASARAERDALQARVAALQTETEGLENVQPDPALVAERERLQGQQDFYATILEDFEGVDTSLKAGFSGPLRAIAQTPVEGLWLQRIRIQPDAIELQGHALGMFEAETLANDLPAQRPFSDWQPDAIDISAPTDHAPNVSVRAFTISGNGLMAGAEASSPDRDATRREVGGIQALLQGLGNSDG